MKASNVFSPKVENVNSCLSHSQDQRYSLIFVSAKIAWLTNYSEYLANKTYEKYIKYDVLLIVLF